MEIEKKIKSWVQNIYIREYVRRPVGENNNSGYSTKQ